MPSQKHSVGYDPLYPFHGTCWTAGELKRLKKGMESGIPITTIAKQLKRKPERCVVVYRELRRHALLYCEDDGATLRTLSTKEKNNENERHCGKCA